MAEDWSDDIDDAIKSSKVLRIFNGHPDPTHQTHFCRRCLQPTAKYDPFIDSGGNIEEPKNDLCSRCMLAVIQGTSVGCDEQNTR